MGAALPVPLARPRGLSDVDRTPFDHREERFPHALVAAIPNVGTSTL
jgi:hypothetical protein